MSARIFRPAYTDPSTVLRPVPMKSPSPAPLAPAPTPHKLSISTTSCTESNHLVPQSTENNTHLLSPDHRQSQRIRQLPPWAAFRVRRGGWREMNEGNGYCPAVGVRNKQSEC
jgi:hypothetical protein